MRLVWIKALNLTRILVDQTNLHRLQDVRDLILCCTGIKKLLCVPQTMCHLLVFVISSYKYKTKNNRCNSNWKLEEMTNISCIRLESVFIWLHSSVGDTAVNVGYTFFFCYRTFRLPVLSYPAHQFLLIVSSSFYCRMQTFRSQHAQNSRKRII